MNYFYDIHLCSGANEETNFYIVLNDVKNSQNVLTNEMLVNNNQYKEYVQVHKPKLLIIDYTVYSTNEKIYASTQPEEFEKLVKNNECNIVSRSEMQIDNAKSLNKLKKRKKRISPTMIISIIGGILIISAIAVGIGIKIGKSFINNQYVAANTNIEANNKDGLIIPAQKEINENAEQITISIDRSYSAVPTEDIQLKGEIIKGKASITLPEFDRTDFFTHVAGYTWGFTTDPNGKKIEYYGGNTYEFDKDTKLYRVLVKYGGGSGTKDDPYLIDYFDQLELMGEEKARGYFKQTADIEFPDWANHTPINTINKLKSNPETEHFEYDGNGFIISKLRSPLFDKVSGAVIKNVNITNSKISSPEYKDYGFIICDAYNFQYKANKQTYKTGETLIQHCTVSHSSINIEYPKSENEGTTATTATTEVVTAAQVVPPDIVDKNGKQIETTTNEETEQTKSGEYCIGAISGLGGQIENCYVTDFGVYANTKDYFLYVGGISGQPSNVFNSIVFFYSAQGKIFNAGGIVGNCGGSRMYNALNEELPEYYGGNIQGCAARKIILNCEVAGGGIAGMGTSSAKNPIISNCYANELQFTVGIYDSDSKLKKSGNSGGIIGCDGNEKNGHIIMNTVSITDYNVIGNDSKSKYDNTIRIAPAYAFYQENILKVINKNTISTDNPQEIFTGDFKFGSSNVFGDKDGALPYPADIEDLFEKTIIQEESQNG